MFKKIILIIMVSFLLASNVFADSQITFIWDANNESDLAGYRLYQSKVSGTYDLENAVAIIPAGTETVILKNVLDGALFWVLTAHDNAGNESGFSNEVAKNIDTIPPSSPKNLSVSVIVKVSLE